MKFIKGSLLTLFFLILLIAAGVVYVLLTEQGSQQLIKTALNLSQAPVSIQTINGTLGHSLQLRGIHWQQDGQSLDLERLDLEWEIKELWGGFIHIKHLILEKGDLILTESQEQSEQELDLAIINPLRVRCDHCEISTFNVQKGEMRQSIEQVLMIVEVIQQQIELEKLQIKHPMAQAEINGTAEMTAELPFQLTASWQVTQAEVGTVVGTSRLDGNLNSVALMSETQAPLISKIEGNVQQLLDLPKFALTGSWQDAQWPIIAEEPQIISKQGQFNLTGTPEQVAVQINSTLQQVGFPQAQISLDATATPQALLSSNIAIQTSQGELKLACTANWENQDAIQLNLTTQADGFNPALFNPQVPGSVNLNSHIEGELRGSQFFGHVKLVDLSGQLRDYPLNGKGAIVVNGEQFQIDNLQISSGVNQLSANGQVTLADANLDYQLNAPDLKAAWPGLSGQIQSQGKISGSFQQPAINADFSAKSVGYENFSLAKTNGNIALSLDPQQQSTIELTGSNLISDSQKLDRFNLIMTGSLNDHQVDIDLYAADKRFTTQLAGSSDGKTGWQGTIAKTAIQQELVGKWQQQQSSQLQLQVKNNQPIPQVTLSEFCLAQKTSQICVDAETLANGELQINQRSQNIPLSLASKNLPEGVTVAGNLNSKAKFFYAQEKLSGNANIRFDQQALVSLKQENIEHDIKLADSVIDVALKDDFLTAELELAKSDLLALSGKVQMQTTGDQAINGKLHARVDDLSLIETLAPQLAPVKGIISAEAKVTGTVNKPVIDAVTKLDDGLVTVQPLGITVEKINFNVQSDPSNLQLLQIKASAHSGKGQMELKGQAELTPDKGWPVKLKLKGDNFQAAQLTEAEVNLSPDLNIVASQKAVNVTGRVFVPKAHITIQKLPKNVVTVSDDEVIVTANPTEIENSQPLKNLTADVTIELGPDINFSGQGLDTNLTGKLRVLQKNNETKVNGTINTKNGYFDAYGQELNLSEGQFQFNGPADNPWLHVVASRLSRDRKITAYVTVQGPLKSPQTKISASDSSLTEQDALAYLLTGRSIDRLGKSDKSNFAAAAIAFGADKATWLTEKIGIDQMDVTEGDTLEDTLLTLGSNLTPDFYVGVTVGLFDHQQNVVIKQSLTDNISVQAESGDSQKVELKYDINVD